MAGDPDPDQEAQAGRALQLLARPGTRLMAGVGARAGTWSLWASGRSGRRPLMQLDQRTFDLLARLRVLRPDVEGSYRLARTAGDVRSTLPLTPCPARPRRRPRALDWLASRTDARGCPWLTSEQRRAGRRLERDVEAAMGVPGLVLTLDPAPRPPGRSGAQDGRILPAVEARQRVLRALVAVARAEPAVVPALRGVCLDQQDLTETARRLRLPGAEVRRRLIHALTYLAAHYRG